MKIKNLLLNHGPRAAKAFMSPNDIGLFLRSARTDATIARLGPDIGYPATFESIYSAKNDPWASNDPRYVYQSRKYDYLAEVLLHGRRYHRALEIGCGLGSLSCRLVKCAGKVLGTDVAQSAVNRASALHAQVPNLRFVRADILNLPRTLDGKFDLVVVADVIYYLPPPLDNALFKKLALRIGELLVPGGQCLLANHYFFAADGDSRQSRRIHCAFEWSPGLEVTREGRRPFYLWSLLTKADKSEPH